MVKSDEKFNYESQITPGRIFSDQIRPSNRFNSIISIKLHSTNIDIPSV